MEALIQERHKMETEYRELPERIRAQKEAQNGCSTAHQLSPEVLVLVFEQVLWDAEGDPDPRSILPFRWVCTYWRRVMLGYGKLWAYLSTDWVRLSPALINWSSQAKLTIHWTWLHVNDHPTRRQDSELVLAREQLGRAVKLTVSAYEKKVAALVVGVAGDGHVGARSAHTHP